MIWIPACLVSFLIISCDLKNSVIAKPRNHSEFNNEVPNRIGNIPLPLGYRRIAQDSFSFGEWIRAISLKKDNRVYLYDGSLKKNQWAQFAILDLPIGKKDLQQCADAVMRIRAEYLFDQKRYSDIVFKDNNGKQYPWDGGNNKRGFELYLEQVFGYCGTASLEKQLMQINVREISPGNVFIKGGFPGHAMMVADVATNKEGKKIILLAQGFMPAQDIHIVINPMDDKLSPWYEAGEGRMIITPYWTFNPQQLYYF